MIPKVTPEAMAAYRATAWRRREAEQQDLAQRQSQAWKVARQAAMMLKEEFGATQVMVFGSLVHGGWFSQTSDVDLAAWGLKDEAYFVAVARMQDISPEFEVDLVMAEKCKLDLRNAIMQTGKNL